jgi:hypothetical protein
VQHATQPSQTPWRSIPSNLADVSLREQCALYHPRTHLSMLLLRKLSYPLHPPLARHPTYPLRPIGFTNDVSYAKAPRQKEHHPARARQNEAICQPHPFSVMSGGPSNINLFGAELTTSGRPREKYPGYHWLTYIKRPSTSLRATPSFLACSLKHRTYLLPL